jgi:hypothetical protein
VLVAPEEDVVDVGEATADNPEAMDMS